MHGWALNHKVFPTLHNISQGCCYFSSLEPEWGSLELKLSTKWFFCMATWSTVLWGEAQKGLLGLLNFPPFYQLPRAFCGYRMGGEFGDYSLQGPGTKLQTQTTWQYMTTCILSEKDGRLLKNAKLYASENLRNMVWRSRHDWPWKCFIPAALLQQAFQSWHAPWRKFNDLQACTSNPCHPSFWSWQPG